MKIRSIKWTYFRGRLREQPRLKLKNSAQENRWTVLFSFLTAACVPAMCILDSFPPYHDFLSKSGSHGNWRNLACWLPTQWLATQGMPSGYLLLSKHVSLLVQYYSGVLSHKLLLIKVLFFHTDLLPNLFYLPGKKVKPFFRVRRPLSLKHRSMKQGRRKAFRNTSRACQLADTSNSLAKAQFHIGWAEVILGNAFLNEGSQGHLDMSHTLDV